MINFAICDDEPWMIQELSRLLSQDMKQRALTDYSIIPFSSGTSLLTSDAAFDILFLDIQMQEPDGLETARRLRQQKNQSLLVFVTVLKECVFDVFDVEAFDYLVKPLESVRLKRTMDRALQRLEQKTEKTILIQQGNSCEVIPLSQILYGEIWRRKIYLHKTDGTVTDYYGRMEDLERRVDKRFFKCHRSYLVNLGHVRGCTDGQVLLSQGKTIPVSRLRERDFTQALLHYMKENA